MDPERAHRVLGNFFDDAKSEIEQLDGIVERGPGDTIRAIFGLPVMREDDATRAVLAATEVIDRAAAMTSEMSDQGLQIQAWIGINTGEVVADPASPASVSGDPLNVALEIQEAAKSGEVLIGAVTHRLVGHAVRTEPAGSVKVAGLAQEIPIFKVLDVRADELERTVARDVPMVGRERDLSLLRETYERTAVGSSPHLITVLGEAGIGKTRLILEMFDEVSEQARTLRGDCRSHGSATYSPLAQILRALAGITGADSKTKAQAKLVQLVGDAGSSDLIVARLAEVIEISEAKSPPEEIFWAAATVIEKIAGAGPLVILFDALHHASPTMLDFIAHLAEGEDVSLLIICTARPEFLERNPSWGGGRPNFSSFSLEPLDPEDVVRLSSDLLGEGELADQIRDRIASASGGNPLFVEQLVSMLVDAGLAENRGGTWIPTSDLSRIPTSIRTLLGSRLEALSEVERQILETSSVLGDRFSMRVVARLGAVSEINAEIRSLVRQGLIRRVRRDEPDTYTFKDGLMREVTYSTLVKGERARLHELAAAELGSSQERTLTRDLSVAYHFEQAALELRTSGAKDERVANLGTRAGELLREIGLAALSRSEVAAAADLLSRGLTVLPRDHGMRADLSLDLCRSLMELGQFAESRRVLDSLSSVELEEEVAAHAAILRTRLNEYSQDLEGWIQEAISVAKRTADLFELVDDPLGLAEAYELWGQAFWNQARVEQASAMYQRAFDHASEADNELLEARLLSLVAIAAFWGPVSAREGARLCRDILSAEDPNRQIVAKCTILLGGFRAMLGEFVEARTLVHEGREIARELGLKVTAEALGGQISGMVEMFADDPVAAEREFRSSHQALERMGERSFAAKSILDIAGALLAQSRFDEAEELARKGWELAAEDELDVQILWRSTFVQIQVARGFAADAERIAREAVRLAAKTDFLLGYGGALEALAEVLRATGQTDAARDALEEAVRLYRKKDVLPAIDRTEKLLASLPA